MHCNEHRMQVSAKFQQNTLKALWLVLGFVYSLRCNTFVYTYDLVTKFFKVKTSLGASGIFEMGKIIELVTVTDTSVCICNVVKYTRIFWT